MKLQYALLLSELTARQATFSHPQDDGVESYAMSVQDWAQIDRPVRITVTVEKL